MSQDKYTHIKVLVDRSGSMGQPADVDPNAPWTPTAGPTIADNMKKALREFFTDQATVPGKCLVDYSQFDTAYDDVYQDVSVGNATAVIQPRGMTALLDAIGKAVTEFGEKLSRMDEADRPGKVMLIIITDGLENASKEWKIDAIKNLIEQQQNVYSWDVVFLGANMDAVAVGGSFGVRAGSSLTYNTADVAVAGASLSSYATNYRTTGKSSFTDADREANKTPGKRKVTN